MAKPSLYCWTTAFTNTFFQRTGCHCVTCTKPSFSGTRKRWCNIPTRWALKVSVTSRVLFFLASTDWVAKILSISCRCVLARTTVKIWETHLNRFSSACLPACHNMSYQHADEQLSSHVRIVCSIVLSFRSGRKQMERLWHQSGGLTFPLKMIPAFQAAPWVNALLINNDCHQMCCHFVRQMCIYVCVCVAPAYVVWLVTAGEKVPISF